MNILLIEDDAGLVELITVTLEESGFSVMSATSGDEALAHLKKQTPDLMLLDYSLPDINGQELIETLIKQQTPPPPFIITTGQGDERIAVGMMKLGAMDYLVKDILFLEMLPNVVKRVIKEIESDGKLKQAEKALIESEVRFRAFMSASNDPTFIKDDQFRYLFANEPTACLFNRTTDELIGKTDEELAELTQIFPSQSSDKLALVSNEQFTIEEQLGDRIFEITKLPLQLPSNKKGIGGIMKDITARKLAEEKLQETLAEAQRFRKALDEVSAYVYMKDTKSRYVYANRSTLELFGCSSEEFIGLDATHFFPPDTIKQVQEQDLCVFAGDQVVEEIEIAGSERRVYWEIKTPIYEESEHKKIWGLLGISTDITEQKKAEEEKRNLESRLQHAQKMEAIGTLAGGIAHDFNNILGIILGYAEMAKDSTVPGTDQEENLNNVLEGAGRAKSLVQQILAFSRQSQLKPIPITIQPLIKEGLKMLRSSIPATISIIEDIDPQSGPVLADPTQIHQVLMNLGTNAYHAMEESGGILSVALKSTFIGSDEEEMLLHVNSGEYVKFSVSDTGSGIGSDVMGKIFDPYFTTKEIGKGTGMGLAITHGIVEGLGGKITVESRIGEGTTFHIYFPVVEEEALPDKKESKEVPRGTERILFIDDEQLLAEMGKVMLERLGYHVTVQHSSLEALEMFQKTPDAFDLVITDQTMYGMTGYDLALQMMQIRPGIPIILCTGYSSSIDEKSAKKIGIKEFVLKPLTMGVIAKMIRNVLKEGV